MSWSEEQQRAIEFVRRIPSGKVMTYGQVGELLGVAGGGQPMGSRMKAIQSACPWQRVISKAGILVTPGGQVSVQRQLLEQEGVEFDERGRVKAEYFWTPGQS